MTAAYLTEPEIIRELRLPEKLGKPILELWKLHPTFPKPVEGTSGRRFMPEVEQWLLRLHNIDTGRADLPPVNLDPDIGARFDEWRAAKTSKTKSRRRAGPDLPPPPVRMGSVVVAEIGPGGKRVQPQERREPQEQAGQAVAPVGGDRAPA
jgi:hypothetical protein